MNLKQKLYQLMQDRKKKFDAAKAILLKDGKTDAYDTAMTEMEAIDHEIEAVKALIDDEEKHGGADPHGEPLKGAALSGQDQETSYQKSVKAFAAAARTGFAVKAEAGTPATEGVATDGGYTVPQDITTRIIKLRDNLESLLKEVHVEPVTKNQGSRTYQKRTKHSGFMTVAEKAKIGLIGTPSFGRVEFKIEKRSGVLPVTEELINDSDANIVAVAEEWLAAEAAATANNEIMTVVGTFAPKDLVNLDGIRNAWMGLGKAFRNVSKVITNTDGMTYLCTLKDKNGRDLLTPVPGETSRKQLVVGAEFIPVVEYDNDVIPTGELNKVPFIIGCMRDAIHYYDRQQLSIKPSDVAVVGKLNAYEEDLIMWKGTIRDDCKKFDEKALINGYITVSGAAAG